jgi:hypothetical protein
MNLHHYVHLCVFVSVRKTCIYMYWYECVLCAHVYSRGVSFGLPDVCGCVHIGENCPHARAAIDKADADTRLRILRRALRLHT